MSAIEIGGLFFLSFLIFVLGSLVFSLVFGIETEISISFAKNMAGEKSTLNLQESEALVVLALTGVLWFCHQRIKNR